MQCLSLGGPELLDTVPVAVWNPLADFQLHACQAAAGRAVIAAAVQAEPAGDLRPSAGPRPVPGRHCSLAIQRRVVIIAGRRRAVVWEG
jgi:hypothetical protein